MKIDPYFVRCPLCNAPMHCACNPPLRPQDKMRRSLPNPHQVRLEHAREMETLRHRVEIRKKTRFWGQEHFIIPRLIFEVFGDGKKLMWLEGINTRPSYWVARVDSSWTPGGHNRDWIEDIYQAIESQFGTGEKENGELYANAKFPQACDLGTGSCWGEFYPETVKKLIGAKGFMDFKKEKIA